MTFTTIALLATGAVGMLGWYFAWRARGEVSDTLKELQTSEASEALAKTIALQRGTEATTAQAQAEEAHRTVTGLQNQLDAERKSRQALVDALARIGAPVGPAVVESALDGLYPNGNQGGSGSRPDSGGHPVAVSGEPSGSTPTSSQR